DDELMLEEDDLGEVRVINNELTVKANIKIFSQDKIDTIKDAYCPKILTDKEIMTDRIVVEGIIKADVLYKTTDEEKNISDIKAEIPFSSALDISGASEGMKSIIRAAVENIDAAIEGNSIAIKVNVILSGKIMDEL
ncbi:DUF3794 domain-containing protein, partial [Clostridium paraputrificum]|uniref:DUF3794 domain-containing protein n=1 Tax=Clostridium paraputrificum TaxID=29363 RepID=UPI000A58EF99